MSILKEFMETPTETISIAPTTATQTVDVTNYATATVGAAPGTVTSVSVKMNGETKGTVTTSGTIDLGTVVTSHQDVSGKEDTSNKVTSISSSSTDTQYPSAKCVYDAIQSGIAIPKITITTSQVISTEPIQIQLTSAQQAIITDTNYGIIEVDGTAINFVDCYMVRKSNNTGTQVNENTTYEFTCPITVTGSAEVSTFGFYNIFYNINTGVAVITSGNITPSLYRKSAAQDAIDATKESTSNKSDSYTTSSSTTYASTKALVDGLSTKQDTISDLSTIRSNASSGASKVSCTDETVGGFGYTKNTGTVTSVAVKMNGTTKGTITSAGTIDLGTVITSHQDISGKEDVSNKSDSYTTSSSTTYASTKALVDGLATKENTISDLSTIRSNEVHYIVGSSSDTAGTWTGTDSTITSYYDGLSVIFVPKVAGASTTTLNINSLGAKTCYCTNTSKLTTHFSAGTPILFTYYGGYWKRADYNDNTYLTAYITTGAATAAKAASISVYTLKANTYIYATLGYSNSAQSALTLNIGSTGAKPIYINGAASSSTNYTLPAGNYIIYYDGTNYYFRTDGTIEYVETTANKTTTLTSSSTDTQYPSAKAVYDKNTSQDTAISRLGELIASGTWNQLCKPYSTTTINGVTATNDGTNKITFSGTSTGTGNFYFLYHNTEVAGHKYYYTVGTLSASAVGSALIIFNVDNNYSEASYILSNTHSDSGIFTAKYSGTINYYVTFSATGLTFSGYIYPQFIDLTVAFGAGNEPTLDEMHTMFPNNYYDYCPSLNYAPNRVIRGLSDLIGSGTWNQLWDHPSSGSFTQYGITSTFSAQNTISVSGTTTLDYVRLTDTSTAAPSLISGHKYFLYLSRTGSNLVPIRVYTSGAVQHTTGLAGSTIFTATATGNNCYLRWLGNSGTVISMTIQFWLCDLTVAFGSGNEPSTVAEMTAMFPNSYYPYCRNRMDDAISYGLDGLYAGTNLVTRFASEIANYSDEWAWVKARIQAGNFNGIHVNDYIPVTANGNTYKARIMGINTYKGYGDTAVGTHIDWMFEDLWPTRHVINKVNYNNGISTQQYPWLASDAYHWANSLSGNVPNATTADPETVAVDYTADGIYYYLPQTLKNVIIEKRMLLPKRYSATGLLSNPNSWGWENIGKIWFPTECEVYGQGVWGANGYEMGGSAVQYPYFAGNMNRVKYRNGSRNNWWLLSVHSGYTTYWCTVSIYGLAYYTSTSNTAVAAPVCFRVG